MVENRKGAKIVEIKELSDLFNSAARTEAVKHMLAYKGKKRIMIDGLAG